MPIEDLRKFDSLWECLFSRGADSTESGFTSEVKSSKASRRRRSRLQSLKNILTSTWSCVGYIAVAVTLVGAVLFFPRLSVSPDANSDSSNPFATPFILHNDGEFRVYSASVVCYVASAATAKRAEMDALGFTSFGLEFQQIGPDKSAEFVCPQAFIANWPFTNAFMEILVSFKATGKATGFPKSWTKKCFWFFTTADKHNALRWFPDEDQTCQTPGAVLFYPWAIR